MEEIKFEFTGVLKEASEGGPHRQLPERSTKNSAGYDFFNPEQVTILPGEIKYVKTGIKAKFPVDYALLLLNRSSNPKKLGLVVANGVGLVDADYYGNPDNDGEIAFAFMNTKMSEVVLEPGQKLGQGMFVKFGVVTNEGEIENERTSGFGSTGV